MANKVGSGIGLGEDFDLELDETGDIKLFQQADELQKDLALLSAHKLDGLLGGRLDKQQKARLRVKTKSVLESDERVTEVTSITVTDDGDTAIIDVELTVEDGQQYDFSFNPS